MPFTSGTIEHLYVSGNFSTPIFSGDLVEFSGISNLLNLTGWMWDFGDTSGASGLTTTHTYTQPGIYSGYIYVSGTPFDPINGLDTWMYDDFSNTIQTDWSGGLNGWIDIDFSGYPGVVRSGNYWNTLTPTGVYMSGAFDVLIGFNYGATNVGPDYSVKYFLNASGTKCGFGSGAIGFDLFPGTDPEGLRLRESGTIKESLDYAFSPYRRAYGRIMRGYHIESGSYTPVANDINELDHIRAYAWLDTTSGWYQMGGGFGTDYSLEDSRPFRICIQGSTEHGINYIQLSAEKGLVNTSSLATIDSSGTMEVPVGNIFTSSAGSILFAPTNDHSIATGTNFEHSASGIIFSPNSNHSVQLAGMVDHTKSSILFVSALNHIVYLLTHPQPPRVTTLNPIYPVLTNMRRSPYRTGTTDQLQAKVEVIRRNRLIYTKDLQVEFWLNYLGDWAKFETSTTTRYGNRVLYHTCEYVPDIDCCLGFARVIINGVEYDSNVVRFNFVYGQPEQPVIYIIDAHEGSVDRSSFDTFDGASLENEYDRMWST